MSDDGFEVRGHHDDEIDDRVTHGEPIGQKIALFSAVLATIGAIVSFLGGHTQNDALYYKNEAVLMKARASDSWSYYQAEDMKRHLAEAVARLSPRATPDDAVAAATYATRARALRATAEEYDRRSDMADEESRHALRPQVKLSIAMTFVQIGIALASISALTRRRWLLWGATGSAAIGIGLSMIAWF